MWGDGGPGRVMPLAPAVAAVVVALSCLAITPATAQQLPPLPANPGLPQPDDPPRPPPPSGSGDSDHYRGNAQRTATAGDDSVFGPLVELWAHDFDAPPSNPLILGNRVLVNVPLPQSGGYGSLIVALDSATGREAWRQFFPGTYFTAHIAADSGRVYGVNTDGVVAAFSVADGKPLWTNQDTRTTYRSGGVPVAADGMLYVARGDAFGADSTVTALDGATGQIRWGFDVEVNHEHAMPALDSERVYMSDGCGEAAALRRDTGLPVWLRSGTGACGAGGVSIVHGGRLYTAGPAGRVYDAETGLDRPPLFESAPDAVVGDLGVRDPGKLLAFDLDTGVGRWTFGEDGDYRQRLLPIVSGGTVFATTGLGNLVGIERVSGEVRSSTSLESMSYNAIGDPLPGMAAGRGVLAVTAGTIMHAFAPILRPAADGLDLAASAFDVDSGARIDLVAGAGSGLRADGPDDLVLESDPYPYGDPSPLMTIRSGHDGAAFFGGVQTARNTRYRVRHGGTASGVLEVFAYPRAASSLYARGRSHAELRLRLTAHGELRAGGRTLFLYFAKSKSRRYSRVGSGRLKQVRRDTVRTAVRFRVPRGARRKDVLLWCIKGLRGYGRADALTRKCGARTVVDPG